MMGVEEARARLFAAARTLGAETVPLADAVGRVLAADVVALRDQPPFSASAMDGYAVRHDALSAGTPLKLVGEAAAGRRFGRSIGAGEAVRIFTGAPAPDGADTVLIQEDAEVSANTLTARSLPAAGANIRRQALDFASGDALLHAGEAVLPRHLALAASGGHAALSVARRPKVAFLATGDELVPPGARPGPDAIVASTAPTLCAMARAVGAEPVDLGIVADRREDIAARAREGLDNADVLVTLGGASVGDHDLVAPALGDLGISLDFWKVAVRPGKPLMFAARPLVMGLPGNPVSGVVCAIVFLLPLLRKLQGAEEPGPVIHNGVLGADLGQNGPRRDHMRARHTPDGLVPFKVQDSSMLSVLAGADALIVRMPHDPPAEKGAACRWIAL
ncbi:MAG: molybdopterin molybdotransferase MoeA [Pseudomonadota bacterium]